MHKPWAMLDWGVCVDYNLTLRHRDALPSADPCGIEIADCAIVAGNPAAAHNFRYCQ
jgi:hypothetical protein